MATAALETLNSTCSSLGQRRLIKRHCTKIAEQPRLDLAPTVELATRIWNVTNHKANQNLTLFPQQVAEQSTKYVPVPEVPRTILTRNTPRSRTPQQDPEGYQRDEATTLAQPRQR